MIRKILSAILLITLTASCEKSSIVQPETVVQPSTTFKDDHIEVVSVKMDQVASNSVNFSFVTRYEKDIVKIEVLRGVSAHNLCVFYEADISGDSQSFRTYKAADAQATGKVSYYMIRYYTSNGDWSFSPLYSVVIK